MERKDVAAQIAGLVEQAQQLVYQAEALADKYDVGFSINIGGYGMGGYYVPVPEGADPDEQDEYYENKYGWMASSQSC